MCSHHLTCDEVLFEMLENNPGGINVLVLLLTWPGFSVGDSHGPPVVGNDVLVPSFIGDYIKMIDELIASCLYSYLFFPLLSPRVAVSVSPVMWSLEKTCSLSNSAQATSGDVRNVSRLSRSFSLDEVFGNSKCSI